MKYLLALLLAASTSQMTQKDIFIFSSQTNLKEWRIVNDDVMGGVSNSAILITSEGYGLFKGHVSLDNNGGFASVQFNKTVELSSDHTLIVLRVKGDGKKYEFRIKGSNYQAESYVHQFSTSGNWETIKLPINKFYPQFRGQILDKPNFNFKKIEQLSFLIANKMEEDFGIEIASIGLE